MPKTPRHACRCDNGKPDDVATVSGWGWINVDPSKDAGAPNPVSAKASDNAVATCIWPTRMNYFWNALYLTTTGEKQPTVQMPREREPFKRTWEFNQYATRGTVRLNIPYHKFNPNKIAPCPKSFEKPPNAPKFGSVSPKKRSHRSERSADQEWAWEQSSSAMLLLILGWKFLRLFGHLWPSLLSENALLTKKTSQ